MPNRNQVLLLRFENRCESGLINIPNRRSHEMPTFDPGALVTRRQRDVGANGQLAVPLDLLLARAKQDIDHAIVYLGVRS